MTKTLESDVARYWNEHIHDMEMAKHPVGTLGFFEDLDEYRFDKLRYLPTVVNFNGYAGKKILEVGCGLGLDLARFAAGGARVTGVDLSTTAIDMARKYFELRGIEGDFAVMDGNALEYDDDSFDVVYVHGVLPYAANAETMVSESHRVLRPGGEAIFMNYNSVSWLSLLTKVTKVGLEHDDAPVFRPRTSRELRKLLSPFARAKIRGERFPVPSRLHKGLKGFLYNKIFVPTFRLLPRFMVRPFGWHLMAYCAK